tara:strand:+ start:583 stop:828 length:246 start_codon:yes stop_codon:yes gene_type:complete
MNDAMKNLMAGNKTAKKKSSSKSESQPAEEKKYKNLYLTTDAIDLLNKVTFMEKATNDKYTLGDAVHDGLKLLAKQKGITV